MMNPVPAIIAVSRSAAPMLAPAGIVVGASCATAFLCPIAAALGQNIADWIRPPPTAAQAAEAAAAAAAAAARHAAAPNGAGPASPPPAATRPGVDGGAQPNGTAAG